jgi:hypoxanthine-guanine phosphoribosyltransferase
MRTGPDGFPDSFTHAVPDPAYPDTLLREARFSRFIPHDELAARRGVLADHIVADLETIDTDKPPLLVILLHGAMKFGMGLAEDIARRSSRLEPEIETAQYRSQGMGMLRKGRELGLNLAGRVVIIAEDIVDRGTTLQTAHRNFQAQGPAALAIACMLQREDGVNRLLRPQQPPPETIHYGGHLDPTPGIHPIRVNYAGFDIVSGFVVGHGLDAGPNGRYRTYPDLYAPDDPGRAYSPSRILGLNPSLVTGPDGIPLSSWAREPVA